MANDGIAPADPFIAVLRARSAAARDPAPNSISLLHQTKAATFFTHDQDYFKRRLVHSAYCLVWLDASDGEAATLIRRFLRHPDFNSAAKSLRTVIRLNMQSISYWSHSEMALQKFNW